MKKKGKGKGKYRSSDIKKQKIRMGNKMQEKEISRLCKSLSKCRVDDLKDKMINFHYV
ncbi:MAG: hypothetical protein V1910_02890 [bacterium]